MNQIIYSLQAFVRATSWGKIQFWFILSGLSTSLFTAKDKQKAN